jgi:hypothetical protein
MLSTLFFRANLVGMDHEGIHGEKSIGYSKLNNKGIPPMDPLVIHIYQPLWEKIQLK